MAVKTPTKVTIRLMREEDIDGVLAIDRKLRGPKRAISFSDPVTDYVGGQVGISYVARAQDQVVGVIMGRILTLFPSGAKGAAIEVLGVDPDWQGHGIGVKLVKAFEEQCRKKGAARMNVWVMPRDTALKPFFDGMGFEASKFVQLEKELKP
ncbi:MAG: GNAT family N-acetyltransferase [Chloroflexi bacterium]|nr:GNAT family N-acetyltransferase [Chloroflexota bacterium]